MRTITCFIPPTSGNVSVAGMDVVRDSLKVRRLVGYLPESNPLYTEMRVTEYLNFRAKLKKVPGQDRRKRVGEAIDRCGLAEVRSRIVGHLSKGFRQRVGLADAIVHNPEVIVLDEPTIGLDPNQVREVRRLIRELGEKRTVILSTHILSEVEILCDRVVIISGGKIAVAGTLREITRSMAKGGRVRLEIKGDGEKIKEKLDKLNDVDRVFWTKKEESDIFSVEAKDDVDIRGALYRACVDNNWELRELTFERASLEDAFVKLTQQ